MTLASRETSQVSCSKHYFLLEDWCGSIRCRLAFKRQKQHIGVVVVVYSFYCIITWLRRKCKSGEKTKEMAPRCFLLSSSFSFFWSSEKKKKSLAKKEAVKWKGEWRRELESKTQVLASSFQRRKGEEETEEKEKVFSFFLFFFSSFFFCSSSFFSWCLQMTIWISSPISVKTLASWVRDFRCTGSKRVRAFFLAPAY